MSDYDETAELRALLEEAADFLDAWWLTQAQVNEDGDVEDQGSQDLVRRIRERLDTIHLPDTEHAYGTAVLEDDPLRLFRAVPVAPDRRIL